MPAKWLEVVVLTWLGAATWQDLHTRQVSNWLTVPLRDTVVTLVVPRERSDAAGDVVTADVYAGKFLGRQYVGKLPGMRLDGQNRFYLQAKDVAGEYSPAISMPSANGGWFVKRPRGRLLLVSDYTGSDAAEALRTYASSLASIPGDSFTLIDYLDIGRGKFAGVVGELVPPFIDPALINTFLLYDYVLWYTDQFPSLYVAQVSLFPYLQNGGKVLFSTSFQNTIDPRGALRDFAPIDSVSSVDLSPSRPPVPPPVAGDTRIPANYIVYGDSSDPRVTYPNLAFNSSPSFHLVFMRPIYRRSDARYVYHLQADSLRGRYLGMPNVAVVDGQRSIFFIGLPLHLLNNSGVGEGLTALFTQVFTLEFNPTQRVNRAEF